MAIPAGLLAIIDRLAAFYNGNAYNPGSNPGGFSRGGNQQGAGGQPQGNFIAMLRDVAGFGQGIITIADDVETARAQAAANRALTAEDASNTALDRITTSQHVTATAGSATTAYNEAERAKGYADASDASRKITFAGLFYGAM